MKEVQNLSIEEKEEKKENEDNMKGGKIASTNRRNKKKLLKRKNFDSELLSENRSLQTLPWAEHADVPEIIMTEKIGHKSTKDLSNGTDNTILEEQPWYQNHQKDRKRFPVMDEDNKGINPKSYQGKNKDGQSESCDKSKYDTGRAGNINQSDDLKSNGYIPEKQDQEKDLQAPFTRSPIPTEKNRTSDAQDNDGHLWNSQRRMQYDKNQTGNKHQSLDISLDEVEKHVKGQGHVKENTSLFQEEHNNNRQGENTKVEGHRQGDGYRSKSQQSIDKGGEGQQVKVQQDDDHQYTFQWDEGHRNNLQDESQRDQNEDEPKKDGNNFDDFMVGPAQ